MDTTDGIEKEGRLPFWYHLFLPQERLAARRGGRGGQEGSLEKVLGHWSSGSGRRGWRMILEWVDIEERAKL